MYEHFSTIVENIITMVQQFKINYNFTIKKNMNAQIGGLINKLHVT